MEYEEVEVGSVELYNFVFVYMIGYGNVVFLDVEVENLCNYLLGGGFFYIDDNYGMDFYVWVVMKKVFLEQEFVELLFEYQVFYQKFEFENGLLKVYKYDDKLV